MSADNEAIPSTTCVPSVTASNSKSPANEAAKRRKWWRTNAPGAASVAAEEATTIDAGDAAAKCRGTTQNDEADSADNVFSSGKPRRTTPTSVPGAVRVLGGREPDVMEPEAALSPPRRVTSGPKPPSTGDADAAAKQRGRRVARPVAPGAVSVPAVEPAIQEPYAAAIQPARAAARSDAVAKNRGRATASATAPGAVSVSMQEPESEQAPSLRQAGRAAAEEVAVAPAQTTRNADAAAKRRGRATARAMAPGAVSVSAEDPEAAPPTAAVSVAPDQTIRIADAAAKSRGRATVRPGAVSVSAEEPEATQPSTSKPVSTAEQDAAAKRRGRRTSRADAPGAVTVGALAPTEMATTGGDDARSELSIPAVESYQKVL